MPVDKFTNMEEKLWILEDLNMMYIRQIALSLQVKVVMSGLCNLIHALTQLQMKPDREAVEKISTLTFTLFNPDFLKSGLKKNILKSGFDIYPTFFYLTDHLLLQYCT